MREILIRVASVFGKRNNLRRKGNFLQFFRDKFATLGYKVEVLKGKEKNNTTQYLIVGDIDRASTLFLTGYDTSSALLIPFDYYPLDRKKNSTLETVDLFCRIIIAVGVLLLDIFIFNKIVEGRFLTILVNGITSLLVLLFLFGVASPYNFERNTAAVTLLYQCAVELRGNPNYCFIYVDKTIGGGAYGYEYLATILGEKITGKNVVVLDCIVNGKDIFLYETEEFTDEKLKKVFEKVGAVKRKISEEERRNTYLRSYPKGLLVISGEDSDKGIRVKKTRTLFDADVDIERVELFRDIIKGSIK